MVWTLSVLAVPVLYLLSVPPLYWMLRSNRTLAATIPSWARSYFTPAEYVKASPMGETYLAYSDWWYAWFERRGADFW